MPKSKKFWIPIAIIVLFEVLLVASLSFKDAFLFNLALLFVLSLPIWVLGMIKPSLIIRWGKQRNRKCVTLYSVALMLASLILFVNLIPGVTPTESNNAGIVSATATPIIETVSGVPEDESSQTTGLIEAKVTAITDGDTFTVLLPVGSTEKIRLLLVDTPETKHPSKPVQPFGAEASEYTESLLSGKTVKLELDVSERDQYGRLLAYVYIEDNQMVNELLLKEGLARVVVYQPNVKYVEQFRAIQKEAQVAKRGIWSIEDYVSDSGYDDNIVAAIPTPVVTVAPTPEPTQQPTQKPTATPTTVVSEEVKEVYYQNCDAVRAAGKAPLSKGEAGYRSALDRDGDGVACESSSSSSSSSSSNSSSSKQPVSQPQGGEVYYQNCSAVRAAGAAPIYRGEPGYRKALDRDGDGVGCE